MKEGTIHYLMTTVCAIVSITMLTTATAQADSQSSLDDAVRTARAATKCPPFQADPLVAQSAQLAIRNSSDYIAFRTAAVPFTDPMPALKTIGFKGSQAKLFSGYGSTDADALTGLMLQTRNAMSDCSLTHYGVSATQIEDGSILMALVLASQ